MKTVAYLRVSTPRQDVRSQRLAILEYARKHDIRIDDFIEAPAFGQASEKRRRLDELTSVLGRGDRLVASEPSRLGRSLGQMVTISRRPRQGRGRLRGAQGEHAGREQARHPDEGHDGHDHVFRWIDCAGSSRNTRERNRRRPPMRRGDLFMRLALILVVLLLVIAPALVESDSSTALPETVWRYNNIITSSDPTALRSVSYGGRGIREFYDRLAGEWVLLNVYLFDVQYESRHSEYQVHPEYGTVEAAREQVDAYAEVVGRLPRAMLSNGREVEISRTARTESDETLDDGMPPSQANQRGIIHIYADAAEDAHRRGYLEEVLIHEAGHLSFDREHADHPDWLAAQKADGRFISPYARDFPDREDVAESLWAYFVVNHRPDRVSQADHDAILEYIPNRLAYFDRQRLDMSPYMRVTPVPALPLVGLLLLGGVLVAVGMGRTRRVISLR